MYLLDEQIERLGDNVAYSLSNVILADEKSTLFHQYLRYSHTCGTIVFGILGAIL